MAALDFSPRPDIAWQAKYAQRTDDRPKCVECGDPACNASYTGAWCQTCTPESFLDLAREQSAELRDAS